MLVKPEATSQIPVTDVADSMLCQADGSNLLTGWK